MASIHDGAVGSGPAAMAVDRVIPPAPDAARYVETMCAELTALAECSGLTFLAYLLEVAREEALLHCDPPLRRPLTLHGERPPS